MQQKTSPADIEKARTVLRRAVISLSIKTPFMTAPGMGTNYIIDDSIATACTDGKAIKFNPAFLNGMSPAQVIGLVAHENMHVGLGHPWRMGGRDPKLWNIACDCQINDIIGDMGYELPDAGVTFSRVVYLLVQAGCPAAKANTIRNESVEYTYNILKEYSQKGGQGGNEPTKPGDGQSKSPIDSIPEPTAGVEKAPTCDDPDGKVAEQAERLASGVEITEMLESKSKDPNKRGSVPGKLKSLIKAKHTNKVDWRSAVWKFASGTAPTDYSYRRVNKIYADEGIYMPVVERSGVGPIAVCIDTSGSVSDHILSIFFAEINAILDTVRPESILIIPCDSKVHENGVEMLHPGDEYNNRNLGGRGGTCFKPPFRYLEDHDISVDKVIYLTDMEGTFPADPGVPTLWVSTVSRNNKAPFGDVVVIDIT
jgi:predicted metal-dependent peptidase